MSLLINSRNNLVTRNASEPLVPSASVWDVERGYGSAVRSTAILVCSNSSCGRLHDLSFEPYVDRKVWEQIE